MGHNFDFVDDALWSDTDDCILWPFYVSKAGYAAISIKGVRIGAHRYICEKVHGPAPDGRRSHAAHSCGNRLCLNPRHLRWLTAKENIDEKVVHGREARGVKNPQAKLTEDQVREIMSLRGALFQGQIANRMGVTRSVVNRIQNRKIWRHITETL